MPLPTIDPEFCARDKDQECIYASVPENVCHHGKIENDNAMRRVLEAQHCEWAKVNDVLGSMAKEGFVPAPDQTAENRRRATYALMRCAQECHEDIANALTTLGGAMNAQVVRECLQALRMLEEQRKSVEM